MAINNKQRETMIKYIIHSKKYRDKKNGNSYFAVRVLDTQSHLQMKVPFQYGYGDSFLTTTTSEMYKQNFIQYDLKPTDYNSIHIITEENCKKTDVLNWGK